LFNGIQIADYPSYIAFTMVTSHSVNFKLNSSVLRAWHIFFLLKKHRVDEKHKQYNRTKHFKIVKTSVVMHCYGEIGYIEPTGRQEIVYK